MTAEQRVIRKNRTLKSSFKLSHQPFLSSSYWELGKQLKTQSSITKKWVLQGHLPQRATRGFNSASAQCKSASKEGDNFEFCLLSRWLMDYNNPCFDLLSAELEPEKWQNTAIFSFLEKFFSNSREIHFLVLGAIITINRTLVRGHLLWFE